MTFTTSPFPTSRLPSLPSRCFSRRTALASAAAFGAAGVIGAPLLGRPGAEAQSVPETDLAPTPSGRLLVVFLRGAADHLSMTVPLDDPDYLDARPNIAIASADALDLDGRFGFHPAMPRLHERYRSGLLVPIVSVGNPAADRSHFVSQSLLERGSDGDGDSSNFGDGWLARHLNSRQSADKNPMRAITVGSNVDASLIGCGALGIGSLRSFGLSGANGVTNSLIEALSQTHTDVHAVEAYAEQAIAAARAVAELPASDERNRTVAAFDDIATLFDADLGTQVITTNIDGWDTHTRMGTSQQGNMRDMLGDLDDLVGGLADRFDASGIDDVTTVVVTEFGRRVNENGSGGCDHGWGSAALVMGPAVQGDTVHGEWMGLAPDVLADSRGDVPMTTDYRDVLGDALEHALGGDPRIAFPDHVPTTTGVFRDT